MATNRFDPWTEMLTLREAMGRLLEDSYVRPGNAGTGATAQPIPLDVWEDADNIEVTATLPGLKPEDVDLTIQGDLLTIKGQHKEHGERKQGNYLVREQHTGSFYRSVQLPVLVDAQKAQAHFEHGMLRLKLPKAETTKPRRIQISASQDNGQQLFAGQQSEQQNGKQVVDGVTSERR